MVSVAVLDPHPLVLAVRKRTVAKVDSIGLVVRMREGPDDIEPGYFVFLGEKKSEMVLSRAGEDEDGDIVVTNEVYRVSVDRRDGVKATEIRVESSH